MASDNHGNLEGHIIMQIYCITRMTKEIKERTILDAFAEDFVAVVEKYARYVIVSGFVAIAHGRSRGTEDVDIIIESHEGQNSRRACDSMG